MGKDLLYAIGGIAFLYGGAELLVRSCISLALRLRISPLVIALTVVSFVTSLPEALTSALAQARNFDDIALGNIIGSNSANIGLVLGIAFLLYPTPSTPTLRRREIPIMMLVLFFLWGIMVLGPIGWVKGITCLLLLGVYIVYQYRQKHAMPPLEQGRLLPSILLLIGGVALLLIGAEGLITGGVSLAKAFGVSERVIALTLIAVGTSLPELATAIVASYRRHTDVIMGSVIGSNIYNSLFITAIAACIAPIEFSSQMLRVDAPIMCGFGLALFFLAMRPKMGRLAGVLLLLGYGWYILFLVK